MQQSIVTSNSLVGSHDTIDVLNQQSYPIVDGYWVTQFVTSGTDDLIVSAINKTTFWGLDSDVSFIEVYDGKTKLFPVIKNNKIIFPDYSASSSDGVPAHLMVKVNTLGIHNIKLEFGSDVAYASNSASPISVTKIDDDTANGPTLSDNDYFGASVTSIGDLNRDGIPDIAVGARGDDTAGANKGAIHIMFMNTAGSVKSTVEINGTTQNGPSLSDNGYFGSSVTSIGDLNRDGIPDIAVGANRDSTADIREGAIYIMFMNTDGSVKSTVKINDDTANGPSLSRYDYFGASVTSIGDLNRDGIPDIAAGANGGGGNSDKGAIHIMFMNTDGSVKSTVKINDDTANGPSLSVDGFFGASVTSIGDLNRDGIPDIAVGANGDSTTGNNKGAIHIMFMNTDGSVKSTVKINDDTANGPSLSDDGFFGASVTSIGDLDGDGVNDIIVGADGDNAGGNDRGTIHIMFMNTNGSVKSTVEINDATTYGPSLSDYDFFGTSVTSIGDLNRDGIPDIAVGARGDATGGNSDKGAIHIISLTSLFPSGNGFVDSTVEINNATTNGLTLSDGDVFGASVASIGDLDHDGVDDIIVGAYGDDAGGAGAGANRGAIHIMFMNTAGSVKSTVEINDDTTNGPSLSKNDNFGTSVTSIGDLDHDGVDDIIVGASGVPGSISKGAIHIMFMNKDGSVDKTVEINDTTTNGPSLSNFDNFGSSVTSIGDLNRDGVQDIAVGAIGDPSGIRKGAIHILFMNITGSVDKTVKIDGTTQNGPSLNYFDNFGSSVTSIGDLNRDGIPDIAVGANGDNAGGGDTRGAIHIMFMNTTGSVDKTVKIDGDTTNGPSLSNTDYFGTSIVSIGDLNRDGIPDIAVGAGGDNTGGDDRGAIHILFMNRDGSVKSTVEINNATTNGSSLSNDDFFGISAAPIGDLNRDGIPDIAVGAYHDDAGGDDRGAIHIIFFDKTTFVTDVASSVNDGIFGTGDTIDVDIIFSESVTVDGAPQLQLETGSDDRVAAFTSGSDSNTLTFQYVVGKGDVSDDLNYVSIDSLILNGGTIVPTRSPNNVATLSLPIPGTVGSLSFNKNIVVDGNTPPTADAGDDQTVNEGDTVTLDATGSVDVDGDSLTYQWTQESPDLPIITLSGSTVAQPTFDAPEVATTTDFIFEVSVSDGLATTDIDTVTITVNNIPTADAGDDQTVNEGDTVTLDATASVDADGVDSLTYQWTQESPDLPTITISDSTTAQPTFDAPEVATTTDFIFKVTVSDSLAATDIDTVTITVNNIPTADAGDDQTVNEGDTVTLDATASVDVDGDSLTYQWTQESPDLPTITISDSTTAQPTFDAPEVATTTDFIFKITVSDSLAATDIDTVTITVNNILTSANNPPIARAGVDQTVTEGDTITLDATTSSDVDGDSLTYQWTQESPDLPTITISDSTATQPTFTAPEVATTTDFIFKVTVSDSLAATDIDTVTITVNNILTSANNPPIARAGVDQTVTEGDTITLDATASVDVDGDSLTYQWTQESPDLPTITISDSTATQPTFTAPEVATTTDFIFKVTVSDSLAATDIDTVTITVNNILTSANNPPIARAGVDQTVTEGDTITLDATASVDVDGDSLTYQWTQESPDLPTITISDSTATQPTFTAPEVATTTDFIFKVTVSDSLAATDIDTVTITVNNILTSANNPPIARAGVDQTVTEGDTITLDATGSVDADVGDSLTYQWTQESPDLPTITISDSTTAQPTFDAPEVATTTDFIFKVTVSDSLAATDIDTVTITVNNILTSANNPPIARAGVDQTVTEGDTITLDATGSVDADVGDSLTYTWTLESPDLPIITLSDSTATQPTFTAPEVATTTDFIFMLTITDEHGSAASDNVIIKIHPGSIVHPDPVLPVYICRS